MWPLLLLGGGIFYYFAASKKPARAPLPPPLEGPPGLPWEETPGETRAACLIPSLDDINAIVADAGGNTMTLIEVPYPETGEPIGVPAWALFQAYQGILNYQQQGPQVFEGIFAVFAEAPPEAQGGVAAMWLQSYTQQCLGLGP